MWALYINKNILRGFFKMPFFIEETSALNEESGVADQNALMEKIFEQEVAMMTEDQRTEYLGSDEVKALEEAGVIGKKTIVRLSKMDDLTRRVKIAAFQKAKEDGDANWEALRKNRIKERDLIGKIMNKYATRVKKDAVVAQKSLLKLTPNAFTRPIGR
jgi:hypothetical protein